MSFILTVRSTWILNLNIPHFIGNPILSDEGNRVACIGEAARVTQTPCRCRGSLSEHAHIRTQRPWWPEKRRWVLLVMCRWAFPPGELDSLSDCHCSTSSIVCHDSLVRSRFVTAHISAMINLSAHLLYTNTSAHLILTSLSAPLSGRADCAQPLRVGQPLRATPSPLVLKDFQRISSSELRVECYSVRAKAPLLTRACQIQQQREMPALG